MSEEYTKKEKYVYRLTHVDGSQRFYSNAETAIDTLIATYKDKWFKGYGGQHHLHRSWIQRAYHKRSLWRDNAHRTAIWLDHDKTQKAAIDRITLDTGEPV